MIPAPSLSALPSSYKDPAGFLFLRGGELYRQVNPSYFSDYRRLMDGLYAELTAAGQLVRHEEVSSGADGIVLRPERISFISYPYEWSFAQLRDAALLTLDIQRKSLARGLSLKDASAYNVQWAGARPVFIDTLSFEAWKEGEPWVAYRQFCRHFLAPLALMAFVDSRAARWLRAELDGLPLDTAWKLLPFKAKLDGGLLLHLGLHAKAQTTAPKPEGPSKPAGKFGRTAFLGMLDSLEKTVKGLRTKAGGHWGDYYGKLHNYSDAAMTRKKELVEGWLDRTRPKTVWDLGANTGAFSRMASSRKIVTVALDADEGCVESIYAQAKEGRDAFLLPLAADLSNPSPSLGWAHEERLSLEERGPAELVLALALVHHLAIPHNLPFSRIAGFFSRLASPWLVVEFVPKTDSQAKLLLAGREDVFADYSREAFEREFGRFFEAAETEELAGSGRVLYLFRRR